MLAASMQSLARNHDMAVAPCTDTVECHNGGDDSVTSDSLMAHHLRSRGIATTDGNSVHLLTSGHDKFVDLFESVGKAKKFIHLEYFNFRNDSIAGLLFHLLAQKAAEGVEVRALYDAFGNASNNKPINKHMHDSICSLGIKLVKFDDGHTVMAAYSEDRGVDGIGQFAVEYEIYVYS